MDVPGYATLSGLRRVPESCGSRSRGSGGSSNRSLTLSEINEVLRGATSKIVGDLTQEIPDKLEPLIPPQASPTTVGMSPHRVQANHPVVGLTNTLGSLRSRPMPTPAAIPSCPSCFDPVHLLLAYLWLGISWIGCISAIKHFPHQKQAAGNLTPAASSRRGRTNTQC